VRDIPHQKALVERHKDEPFAILGINSDTDKEEYKRKVAEYGVTWRSAWQGAPGGPIGVQWGVRTQSTVFVLDANQVIRYIGVSGADLDKVIDDLLRELAGK
jgi:hypothetical protein